jgi:hypothetical protein
MSVHFFTTLVVNLFLFTDFSFSEVNSGNIFFHHSQAPFFEGLKKNDLLENSGIRILNSGFEPQSFSERWLCNKVLKLGTVIFTGHKKQPYRFWQAGGGYDRNVISRETAWNEIHYIHQNPVRRELVKHPGDWTYSSYKDWNTDQKGPVEIDKASFYR